MRTLITTVLLLALGISADALTIIHGPVAHSPYIYSDNFEYANAAAATAVGYQTVNGTFAYATSPAPLEGSRSLYLYAGAVVKSPPITTSGEVWITFDWVPVAFSTDSYFINWSGVGVLMRSAGTIRIVSGTNTSGSYTYTAGVNYRVKIRFVPGTGNAVITVYVYNTSDTLLETLSKTNGTAGNLGYLEYTANTGAPSIIDRVRITSSDQGIRP